MAEYIGVDVGANTGLAVIDDDGRCLLQEVHRLEGCYGERLVRLRHLIQELITPGVAMLVVEEPPRVKSTTVYNQLSGYEAIVIMACEEYNLPYASANNATIKKVIVRGGAVGKSSKEDMMFAAASLMGEPVPEFRTKTERDFAQNGYDAVLCAFYARHIKGMLK